LFFSSPPRPPTPTLFPYTTLFRSLRVMDPSPAAVAVPAPVSSGSRKRTLDDDEGSQTIIGLGIDGGAPGGGGLTLLVRPLWWLRSEEHTSELQSRFDLVCRLLLEK